MTEQMVMPCEKCAGAEKRAKEAERLLTVAKQTIAGHEETIKLMKASRDTEIKKAVAEARTSIRKEFEDGMGILKGEKERAQARVKKMLTDIDIFIMNVRQA